MSCVRLLRHRSCELLHRCIENWLIIPHAVKEAQHVGLALLESSALQLIRVLGTADFACSEAPDQERIGDKRNTLLAQKREEIGLVLATKDIILALVDRGKNTVIGLGDFDILG